MSFIHSITIEQQSSKGVKDSSRREVESDSESTYSAQSRVMTRSKKNKSSDLEEHEEEQGVEEEEVGFEEKLDEAFDDLSEKRSSTRVSALGVFRQYLRLRHYRDVVVSRQDSLLSILLSGSCRKPTVEAEGLAALEVLSLLSVTVGNSNESVSCAFVQDVFPVLETLVKHDTRSGIQAAVCVFFDVNIVNIVKISEYCENT